MTASDIIDLPDSAFAGRPYRSQRLLIAAARDLRRAADALRDGNVGEFLSGLRQSSFQRGLQGPWTPSAHRLSHMTGRLAVAAAERLRVVEERP